MADRLRSELTLFDATNLVVGSIIGADIYVASSFGAGSLGPFSLLVWVIAGIISTVIALCFAECVALLPKVGGSYAYAREAWGSFAGFVVGWSLWLAEWMSLAVFPVAFTRYLMFFLPDLAWTSQTLVKCIFVAFLISTNIRGVKAAGRINDILTIVKLTPLVFFSGVGLIFIALNPSAAAQNYSPFAPYGFTNFGEALILIFWAYAGFEISTIPAEEIRDPGKTIPRAILLGISIVTVFYLTTNTILFGVRPWTLLANDTAPLASATTSMLSSSPVVVLIGGAIVGLGALISVAGSDESGMLGTSRLGYALASDGLFPRPFAKIHTRFKTPYLGIIIQGLTALVASIVGGLSTLIATSVFFMAIAYAATSAAIFPLRKKNPKPVFHPRGGSTIPVLGLVLSLYLVTQCTFSQIGTGLLLLLLGVPIYVRYTPKKEIAEIKEEILSRQSVLNRAINQEEQFMAHLLRHLKSSYEKTHRKPKKEG